MGIRSRPLRAELMSAYSLVKFNCLSELQLHATRSNLCRVPLLLVGMPNDKYNNQRVPKPLLLVKEIEKDRTNT